MGLLSPPELKTEKTNGGKSREREALYFFLSYFIQEKCFDSVKDDMRKRGKVF